MNKKMRLLSYMAIILVPLAVIVTMSSKQKIVVLVPFDPDDTSDQFFEPRPDNYWCQLKEECLKHGYLLTTQRDAHDPSDVYAIVYFNARNLELLDRYSAAKKILYMWEPPVVLEENYEAETHNQFDIIATWNDDLVDGVKYHKFHYPVPFSAVGRRFGYRLKKFCCMFVGNKFRKEPHELYSQRRLLIHFFEENAPKDLDLYGIGWKKFKLQTYKGFADDKVAAMLCYRFTIAYENTRGMPGYITEKLLDAFSAGCVPIYWGAPNITDYVPAECFIDRRKFKSNIALYYHLKKMSTQEYEAYQQAMREFLASDKARIFTPSFFNETFVRVLSIEKPHKALAAS